jgi:hypothetical protein
LPVEGVTSCSPEPTLEVQQQGAGGTGLNFKMILYAYVALGVSRRPEASASSRA